MNSNEHTDILKQNAVTEHLDKQDDSKMRRDWFRKKARLLRDCAANDFADACDKHLRDDLLMKADWLEEAAAQTAAAEKYKGVVQLIDEYLQWRRVNPHIKGVENYVKRMSQAIAELERE